MSNIKKIFAAVVVLFVCFAPLVSRAQANDAVALTITPPFFEFNANPGDSWSSSIRVVNTNPGSLPVHASVAGFAPGDEEGHGTFVDPSALVNDQDALANWIVLSDPSVSVPSGEAVDVPFSVVVPKDAAPGGHYGAILIGTEPSATGDSGSHVGVGSFISALIFVSVSGDVKEQGSIREFSTDHQLYQDPNVQFTLRFANDGNVHVRPQGEIDIYDAFGKERGKVDVNQNGDLGYVLPSSTRRFDLSWQGSPSLWDIGEYSAVATLSYGAESKKSVSQAVTFWVLPLQGLAEVLFGGIFIIAAAVFILRRLIRKMLARELARYESSALPNPPKRSQKEDKTPPGVVDLRKWKDR